VARGVPTGVGRELRARVEGELVNEEMKS
jgi:hypothetical protein